MSDSRINKLNILLCIIAIFVTIIAIHYYTNKSSFKLRRSIPSIYYDGNIYSIYGSIGNPYTLYGQPTYNAPNVDMLLYGQNAPYVMN